MIRHIIRNISFFIPKRKRICMYSNTFLHGNSYYLREVLKSKDLRLIYLSDEGEKNTTKLKTLKGLWIFITSKFILSSHLVPLHIKSRNQIHIHYWHGQPIKSFGNINAYPNHDYSKDIDFQVSSSNITSMAYAFGWNLKPNQFLRFGEPIYDFFNDPERFLQEDEKAFISTLKKNTILYAPTYRRSRYSEDGEPIEMVLLEVLKFSEAHPQYHVLISCHPFEELSDVARQKVEQSENVSFSPIPTEKILPFIDTVILDISSVYHHALYLNKKILMFFPDIESYKKTRGILFDKLEVFPKEIICNDALDLGKKIEMDFSKELQFVRDLFFTYKIENACEQIYDFVKEYKGKQKSTYT